MAKLYIKSFGPIKDLEMETGRFNLLIGEQATGKSTICKVIYFFREMKNVLIEYFYKVVVDGKPECGFQKALVKPTEDILKQLFGSYLLISSEFSAEYVYKPDVSIKIWSEGSESDGRGHIGIQYGKRTCEELENIEVLAQKYYETLKTQEEFSEFTVNERTRLYKKLVDKVTEMFGDDMSTYYIPAGRSVLSLLPHQKTRLNYDAMDLVNRRFLQFIEEIQPVFSNGICETHKQVGNGFSKFDEKEIAGQIVQNLRGEYVYANGSEYLKTSGENIPITYVSSGQQEELWLLNQLYVLMLSDEKSFVIIEEPEAHIYPLLQRDLLEFICQFMNLTGSTVFITTHSPYILTAANVLYRGGRLVENVSGSEETVADILGGKKYIQPKDIRAYKLERNRGNTYVENLIDREEDELRTELIDDVSEEINRKYTELFYLEEEYEPTNSK